MTTRESITRKKHTGQTGNGGEFGNHTRDEATVVLSDIAADQVFTARDTGKSGYLQVTNDQIDPPPITGDGFTRHTIHIGGIAHTNVRAKAILSLYRDSEKATAARAEAESLAAAGEKMTALCITPRGAVSVREGTGMIYHGNPMLKAKGSRTTGYYLDDINVVGVAKGYGKSELLIAEYQTIANGVPVVDKPSYEDIPDWSDNEAEPPNDIAAAFLIDGPDFGEGSAPGCLFLATDIQAEDKIVNGYFWAPDDSGVFSEHGSMYYEDLDRRGGRIRDYKPGALTFSEVMGGDLGHDRAAAYAKIAASQ